MGNSVYAIDEFPDDDLGFFAYPREKVQFMSCPVTIRA
jgi:hypothetical protein